MELTTSELDAIYKQFHQLLLNFIKSKVKSHQDAEDILQNVFIKVISGYEDLNRKEKLQSWIYTITRNSIIDYYRSSLNKEKAAVVDDVSDSFTDEEYIDTTKGLDCCLLNFVKQLPEEYRDIIIDVEIRGIKQKDLAKKYDLAYPSIRSRVQRGRERLKQILLDCCNIHWDAWGNIIEASSKLACSPGESQNCKK